MRLVLTMQKTTKSQSIENQIVEAYLFKRNISIFCLTFFPQSIAVWIKSFPADSNGLPKNVFANFLNGCQFQALEISGSKIIQCLLHDWLSFFIELRHKTHNVRRICSVSLQLIAFTSTVNTRCTAVAVAKKLQSYNSTAHCTGKIWSEGYATNQPTGVWCNVWLESNTDSAQIVFLSECFVLNANWFIMSFHIFD